MFLIKRLNKMGKVRKYDVCLTIEDGRTVKFPGDRNEKTAIEKGRKIELLVKAKVNGDPPPLGLAPWIENMPEREAERFIGFGLLPRRRLEQKRPLTESITAYQEIVAARRHNTAQHAYLTAKRIRRLCCTAMNIQTFNEIREDGILLALKKMTNRSGTRISVKTRREYIFAIKGFCKWMTKSGRASANPIAELEPPGARVDPVRRRRPLTVGQFRELVAHLDTGVRHKYERLRLPGGQHWNAQERKLFYWVAVKTAFRVSELRRLQCTDLQLDTSPATIFIRAASAKNKTEARVPIPTDLAAALREHIAGRRETDRVFIMPKSRKAVLRRYYQDLAAAGINSRLEGGEIIDFHTLRSTAITWWLTEDKLPARKVQFMARLKTLALVDTYSRYYDPHDFAFLDNGPSLAASTSAHRDVA